MTEDDTFKKLRGLTPIEAYDLYENLYIEAMQSDGTVTIQDVKDWIDRGLKPYGWTSAKIEGRQ